MRVPFKLVTYVSAWTVALMMPQAGLAQRSIRHDGLALEIGLSLGQATATDTIHRYSFFSADLGLTYALHQQLLFGARVSALSLWGFDNNGTISGPFGTAAVTAFPAGHSVVMLARAYPTRASRNYLEIGAGFREEYATYGGMDKRQLPIATVEVGHDFLFMIGLGATLFLRATAPTGSAKMVKEAPGFAMPHWPHTYVAVGFVWHPTGWKPMQERRNR
jgi:hypothetical protein